MSSSTTITSITYTYTQHTYTYIPVDAIDAGCFQHVAADLIVVRLNKAHMARVGRQVEHILHALGDGQAVVHDAQIHQMELVTEHVLTHVLILLPVRSHDVVALTLETPGNMRRNESSGSRDGNPQLPFRPVRLPIQVTRRILPILLQSVRNHHPRLSLLRQAKSLALLPSGPERFLSNYYNILSTELALVLSSGNFPHKIPLRTKLPPSPNNILALVSCAIPEFPNARARSPRPLRTQRQMERLKTTRTMTKRRPNKY